MIKIGLVDFYIDEWHANNFAKRYRELADEVGVECEIAGVFALTDSPAEGSLGTAAWCESHGFKHLDKIEALAAESDAFIIFAPDDPERHPELARLVLPFGKPTFIDKTFALTVADAKYMLDLAKACGARMYTTSSLRYADEVRAARGASTVSLYGNYVHLKDYLVHTAEMVITVLGVGVSSVCCDTDGEKYTFTVEYADQRRATVEMTPVYGFKVNGKEVESDIFGGQIKDMLRFFVGGESPVSTEEILDVARLVEGGMLAANASGRRVNLSSLG
ncbi:MAG: Gfo/Idh/MocA family oxidoreductase [Clostridia bacterium]|nr:Gfo/Idh/MocA family oxidoreductase [Clostridia bacterium]